MKLPHTPNFGTWLAERKDSCDPSIQALSREYLELIRDGVFGPSLTGEQFQGSYESLTLTNGERDRMHWAFEVFHTELAGAGLAPYRY